MDNLGENQYTPLTTRAPGHRSFFDQGLTALLWGLFRLEPLPAGSLYLSMDIPEQHGRVSAFYFICRRTDPAKDVDYAPEHPAIRQLLRDVHARGHEIGLYPSYNTDQFPGGILAETQRLKRTCTQENIHQSIWGERMHYLRWEHPTTMRARNDAGRG